MRTKNSLLLLATCAALAACGGGDDDNAAAPATAQPSAGGADAPTASGSAATAFGSVSAFVAFIRQLGADETSEPLALPAGTSAPTSDTAEPAG